MAFSLSPHRVQKIPGTDQSRIIGSNHYMRLSKEGTTLFLQSGNVYSEGGQRYKEGDLPEWFEDEVAKISPKAMADCGFAQEVEEEPEVEEEDDTRPEYEVDFKKMRKSQLVKWIKDPANECDIDPKGKTKKQLLKELES